MWVAQQLLEAFPFDLAPKYLIVDRAKNFGEEVCIMPTRLRFAIPETLDNKNDASWITEA